MALEEKYEITIDWEGTKYSGIDIKWDYALIHKNRKECLSMKYYINDLLIKVGHIKLIKAQLSPYRHNPIFYGESKQFTSKNYTSFPLDAKGILWVQKHFGALLYYGLAVDNKLLVSLSAIRSQQAAATVDTAAAVCQLLEYIATYPQNGIT